MNAPKLPKSPLARIQLAVLLNESRQAAVSVGHAAHYETMGPITTEYRISSRNFAIRDGALVLRVPATSIERALKITYILEYSGVFVHDHHIEKRGRYRVGILRTSEGTVLARFDRGTIELYDPNPEVMGDAFPDCRDDCPHARKAALAAKADPRRPS